MSKNTKIIAGIGGALILILIIFSAVTKGGCGGAVDVWKGYLGCSAKKKAEKKPSTRNFCVQNPNDPRCKKATKPDKGGDKDDADDKDDKDARKAPARDDARKAPARDDARKAPAREADD